MTLPSLDYIQIGNNNAVKAVIWLHGLGANGHDFEPIVPELGLAHEHSIRFIFPHAPDRAVTINNGMVMPAWYDIFSMEFTVREDETGIRESAQQVCKLIDQQVQLGIKPANIIIAGFSQGGAIALQTALRYPQKLAGVMVLSSYLPLASSLAAEKSDANRSTPLLFCHGDFDPVVPVALGKQSCQFLQQQGYPVDWRSYPMEHSVCQKQIGDIAQWLEQVL